MSATDYSEEKPFKNINLLAIYIAWNAIFGFLLPFMLFAIAIGNNVSIGKAWDYLYSEDVAYVLGVIINIVFLWYLYKIFKISRIDFKRLLGSLKKVDLKLPFLIAVVEYFFNWGFNSITLYYLSFIIPTYVENRINKEHVITYPGFLAFAISAVLIAPILEEILLRGILFQKLAINKNLKSGIFISAIVFAIIHFRYDVIPLFISGIIYVLLYLKTKQLIIPILSHFFYNLIVTIRLFHHQFLSNYDHSIFITVADYQEQFINNLSSRILFIAFSAPYLIYFIYRNYPRNYNLKKLPHFANKTN